MTGKKKEAPKVKDVPEIERENLPIIPEPLTQTKILQSNISVGDSVQIKKGAVFRAEIKSAHHKIVPDYLLKYTYTVTEIRTVNNVTMAHLSRINADFPINDLVKNKYK